MNIDYNYICIVVNNRCLKMDKSKKCCNKWQQKCDNTRRITSEIIIYIITKPKGKVKPKFKTSKD